MLRLDAIFRRQILPASYALIRCRRAASPEAKQCLERGRGRPPAVVPERELVQVDLELGSTDTMVRADEPLLQVADRAVRQRHDRLGSFAQILPQRLCAGDVLEAGNCFSPSV